MRPCIPELEIMTVREGVGEAPAGSVVDFLFHDLAGRCFVITGAGNGIGRELARCLAQQGCRLILVDKDEAGLRETQRQIKEHESGGTRTKIIVCDLSSSVERHELGQRIAGITAVVDGVVHNAAIDPRSSLEETNLQFFRHVMATNVEPALEITRDLLPLLQRSEAGRVVMIGSVTFEIGTALLSSYAASKGALVGLTRSWAHELGVHGITVNCIAPGAIAVEKELSLRHRKSGETTVNDAIISWQSVQRELLPQDLSGALCLLLSRAGGAITGQTIQVDGGLIHPLAAASLQSTLIG